MIPERRAVKEALLADKRRWGSSIRRCEAVAYVEHEHQKCSAGLHLNEVIFTREDIKHLTDGEKRYFWSELNCSLMCEWSHMRFGHSKGYRKWFMERVSLIYGGIELANFIAGAPLKVRPRYDQG